MNLIIEYDLNTILACFGITLIAGSIGLVWCIHRGWLSPGE